jgi:acyl-CoA thioesterase
METSQTHPLDAAIALEATGEHRYAGRTSADYANMVGPFGGVIAATLLNAALQHPQRLGEPLSLTVHYAAPIADGEYEVNARPMRTNRTTQHWLIELIQQEQVAAFATAVFATRRDTWSATDLAFPAVPPADSVPVAPAHPRAAWTQRFQMRFVKGVIGEAGPENARPDSLTQLWMRDEPPRPLDHASLASLCDAFFPRLFVRRPSWVPIGTVALTTYFHADAAQLAAQGSEPVLGVARAGRFGKGFFDQSAEVWSSDGELLAVSNQVVYFKE